MAKLHYFSDKEAPKQESFAKWRTAILAPVLMPLCRLGITADHLTLLGILMLVPYAYTFFHAPQWAAVLVWCYVLFDGLDGALARATGTATPGGALSDIVADQLGLVVSCLLIVAGGLAPPVLACYYSTVYVTMIALSVAQNAHGIPMQTILRSKYLLYGAVGVWAYTGVNLFHWIMGVFSVTMTVNCLQSFLRLRRHLSAFSP